MVFLFSSDYIIFIGAGLEYADAFGAMDFANIYGSLSKEDLQVFEKSVDGER